MIDVLLIRTEDRSFLINKLQHQKQIPIPSMPFEMPDVVAFCDITGSHFIVKVSFGTPLKTENQRNLFPKLTDFEFYSLCGNAKLAIAANVLDKRNIKIVPSLWSEFPTICNPIVIGQSSNYGLNCWGSQEYNPRPRKAEPIAAKGLLSGSFVID